MRKVPSVEQLRLLDAVAKYVALKDSLAPTVLVHEAYQSMRKALKEVL